MPLRLKPASPTFRLILEIALFIVTLAVIVFFSFLIDRTTLIICRNDGARGEPSTPQFFGRRWGHRFQGDRCHHRALDGRAAIQEIRRGDEHRRPRALPDNRRPLRPRSPLARVEPHNSRIHQVAGRRASLIRDFSIGNWHANPAHHRIIRTFRFCCRSQKPRSS